MTIEEKAKAYDEVIEEASAAYEDEDMHLKATLESIFPELKESEDERIRKQLLKHLREVASGKSLELSTTDYERWATWVESQSKQKPQWNEYDEYIKDGLIRGLKAKRDIHGHTTFSSDAIDITDAIEWLESLKDRVQPQHEWNKEDEKCIRLSTDIIDSALRAGFCVQLDRDRCVDWLKSIRPQNRWKPSDEQMVAIQEAMNIVGVLTITGSKINSRVG